MFEHHHLELLKSLTKNLRKKIQTMTTFLFGGKVKHQYESVGIDEIPQISCENNTSK